jgi:hypothetical protein
VAMCGVFRTIFGPRHLLLADICTDRATPDIYSTRTAEGYTIGPVSLPSDGTYALQSTLP